MEDNRDKILNNNQGIKLEGRKETFSVIKNIADFFHNAIFKNEIKHEAVALIDNERVWTFCELDKTSSKLAEVIRRYLEQVQKDEDEDIVIGVCIHPSDKLIVTLFAILKLGTAYMPIDAGFPDMRIEKMIQGSRPVMIVCDPFTNVVDKFDSLKDLVIVKTTAELFDEAKRIKLKRNFPTKPLPGNRIMHERSAMILYTSGSSGEPKGVRLSHQAVLNRLSWQWQTFPFEECENCVFKTSLTFVDSVAEIFGPILKGHSITIWDKAITSVPNIVIQKLDQFKITRIVLVPSLLKAIFQTMKIVGVDHCKKLLTSVKLWVCSGEILPKDLLIQFFDYFPSGHTLCNFYGSTEVMGDVTYVTFSNADEVYRKCIGNSVPIGFPISNTTIYILNPDMEICEENVSGEIYVAGFNLATGYVGITQSESFVPNVFSKSEGFNVMYRTGDFGKIASKGNYKALLYDGRIDSQIKVRGQRVDLSEIEHTIGGIDFVKDVKVLCYHPRKNDQAIVAFIVLKNEEWYEKVCNVIEKRLRDYEMPVVRILDSIPLLINQKPDRRRLLNTYEKECFTGSVNCLDLSNLEFPKSKIKAAEIIIKTISKVTGTSLGNVVDNLNNSFFNIGGTSLNCVEVILELKKKHVLISIQEFILAKSIKEIIQVANMIPEEVNGSIISDIENKNFKPYNDFFCTKITEMDKVEAIHMIAHSFSKHGDLEYYIEGTYIEWHEAIEFIWNDILSKGFSFIVRRKSNKVAVAVSINFDLYDKPSMVEAAANRIPYIEEMIDILETSGKEKLPKGKGKLIHNSMIGTSDKVDQSENVMLVEFIEREIVRMAKEKNFLGIVTTNTNPLTQQIGKHFLGYEVLSELKINEYVAPDGIQPFILAPNDFKIVCCWKRITDVHDVIVFDNCDCWRKMFRHILATACSPTLHIKKCPMEIFDSFTLLYDVLVDARVSA